MADRYWVGGTAAWDGTAGTKWALTSGGAGGQSVPTTSDNVFFTSLSTGTCTISSGNTGALSIDCTGHTGTIAGTAAITVAGSVTFVAGQTLTYTGTLTITGTGTIATGGKTLGPVTLNGSGATFTLGSALTSSGIITLTEGTLTTSGSNYAITARYLHAIGSLTRVITLNGSTVTGTDADYAWRTNENTNLTLNAGTSTVVSSGGGSIRGDSRAFNNITMSGTTAVDGQIIFASCNTLTITGPAATGETVYGLTTSTITTLAFTGTGVARRVMLVRDSSDLVGTQATLTCTSVTGLSDIDFRDIAFNSLQSGTRLGNCGGNSNITFPAAKTVYWNLSGTQSWGATGWATTSGGSPAANNFPLAQDTAIIDDTGLATQINLDSYWNLCTLNMSARSSALTINFSVPAAIYGTLTTGSGITYSGTTSLRFANRSAATLTSAGKTFTNQIIVAAFGSSLTLQDAFVTSRSAPALAIGYGDFNANGYNITLSGVDSEIDIGTTGARSSSATRSFNLSTGTMTLAGRTDPFDNSGGATGLTVTGSGVISLTSASGKRFNGTGVTYGTITINQGGSGSLDIVGSNSFGGITNSYRDTGATTIRFQAGTTTTFLQWTARGDSGKLLTIGSTTASGHTLSIASGNVNANFLSVSRSNATGGADWYAGANSVDGGNNTGWIFANGPGSSGFMAFFI